MSEGGWRGGEPWGSLSWQGGLMLKGRRHYLWAHSLASAWLGLQVLGVS